MKRTLATITLVAAWGVFGVSGGLRAAPLDASTVSADAKWLVHVDFDAAHDAKIATRIREEVLKHDKAKAMVAKIQEEFGMDPHKDLHGATLYGTGFKPHTGVLIVYANADHDKVMEHLKKCPDFKSTKEGDTEVYSITAKHGKDKGHEVFIAFPKTGVGVAAGSADELKAALGVLGGKGGLASSSPLVGDAPKGTILRGAAVGIAAADLPHKEMCPLAKQIEKVSFVAGESDGNAFDKLTIDTTDDDVAANMKKVADGFVGLADFRVGDDADLKKLVDATKIEASGKTFTVSWSAPADDVIKMGEKLHAKMQEHRKARKHDGDKKKDEDKKDSDK